MGNRPWCTFGHQRTNPPPPEPPGCLILENLQTLHIPTNKKLEVYTQNRLLSLVAAPLISRKYLLVIFRWAEMYSVPPPPAPHKLN